MTQQHDSEQFPVPQRIKEEACFRTSFVHLVHLVIEHLFESLAFADEREKTIVAQ